MGLPTVKESCCGCTLETGAKIIGYVHLILSCVAFLVFAAVVASVVSGEDGVETTTESPIPTGKPQEDVFMSIQFGLAVSAFLALAPAVLGISSLFLLIGAKKKKPYLILPWLIGVGFLILIYLGLLVLFFYILLTGGTLNKTFVSLLVKICVCCYCYLVVYSFYRELKEDKREQA